MQLFHLLSQRETNSIWLHRIKARLVTLTWIQLIFTQKAELYCIQPQEVIRVTVQPLPCGHRRAHQRCHVILRYYQSTKSSGLSSNLQPTGAKADHLREEMEEAANRMEICRVSHQLPSRHISPYYAFSRWTVNIIHLLSTLGMLLIDISLCYKGCHYQLNYHCNNNERKGFYTAFVFLIWYLAS